MTNLCRNKWNRKFIKFSRRPRNCVLEIENYWNNWGKGSFLIENTSRSIIDKVNSLTNENEREFFRGIEVIPNDYIAMFENEFGGELNRIFRYL